MSSKMSQREAVYTAVKNVLAAKKVAHEDGQDVGPLMDRDARAQVAQVLIEGFQGGQIELGTPFEDEKKLRSYVSGLISNWLRKDTRLNGGTKYVPANPGSRAGSTDASIKAMRLLRNTLTNPEDIAEVDQHIATRLSQLKQTKAPAIDVNALPESLRNKVPQAAGSQH